MDRIIMHIDVNNAFLSWTAVDLLKQGFKYDIRNSYAIICGDPKKRSGIVLAKSTPAKKQGVVTGEPIFQALKKCRALKGYPCDYKLYSKMSDDFIKLLEKYTPDIEQVSIDECFIDYGKVKNLYGCELEFAKKIQKEIFDNLGFTVNVGIANNKLCAKMASDFTKPNKIHTLYDYEIIEKMYPLKIGELYGIGKKTVPKLEQIGINTIKDLATIDPIKLSKVFKNHAMDMINRAKGIDNSIVDSSKQDPKGIGHEITLETDIYKKEDLIKYILQLSDAVTLRLRKLNKYASVVVVVLKDNKFRRKSHQIKLKNATNKTDEVFEVAKKILNEMTLDEPIRLIGVRLDNLHENYNHQVSLFDDFKEEKNTTILDKTMDELKQKYGNKIINKASLKNTKLPNKLK